MNLEEEIRNGYKVTSYQKQVWSVQMQLLRHLLDVCDRHNLKIWAEGGTLLGVIRHKGYIPWDDDIDMLMMREDYDKLIALASEEFKEPYFLQCASTEKDYVRGHAQLRMCGTSALLPIDKWQNFHQGIFIDIFVYDKLPVREKREAIFAKLEKRRNYLIRYHYETMFSDYPVHYLYSFLKVLANGGSRRYFKKLESLIIDCKDTCGDEVGDVLWTSCGYEKYMRDVAWYRDTVYMPFEDMLMPVPVDYDKVLTRQYGDYMKPVKAPSNHGSVIFYVDKDYRDTLYELRMKSGLKEKLKHPFKYFKTRLWQRGTRH